MESLSIVVGISGSVVFLLLLLQLVQRTRVTTDSEAGEPEDYMWSDQWFEEFSAFRYLPMRRLLSAEDEAYYVQSTKNGPANVAAFRAERRRLFCEYLRLIRRDFNLLSQGLRLTIVHADKDQTAEIQSLVKLEFEFRKLMLLYRCRVAMHWMGLRPVDATDLINALQGLEFGLREMQLRSAQS